MVVALHLRCYRASFRSHVAFIFRPADRPSFGVHLSSLRMRLPHDNVYNSSARVISSCFIPSILHSSASSILHLIKIIIYAQTGGVHSSWKANGTFVKDPILSSFLFSYSCCPLLRFKFSKGRLFPEGRNGIGFARALIGDSASPTSLTPFAMNHEKAQFKAAIRSIQKTDIETSAFYFKNRH